MMKAETGSTSESERLKTKSTSLSDASILDSFDPVIEGASFQLMEEGIKPSEFSSDPTEAEATLAPQAPATFDLGASLAQIPNKLFFRIGDAAKLLEVKPYVLRFWETEFPMIRPTKSRSGQRVYRKKDVEMLFLIKHLLYIERFSIEGARKRIRELKMKPVSAPVAPVAARSAPVAANSTPVVAVSAQAVAPKVDTTRIRELVDSALALASNDLTKFFRF